MMDVLSLFWVIPIIIFIIILLILNGALLIPVIAAALDAYDELSFEFITKEECIQRIEKSSNSNIQKTLNTKFLFVLINAEFLLEILEDQLETITHTYSKEEILARKFLYEHLDEKYKKRYLEFLADINVDQVRAKEMTRITGLVSTELKSEISNKAVSDLVLASKRLTELAERMEVVMIRKKPGGKRPPKKTAVIQNIFLPAGGRA